MLLMQTVQDNTMAVSGFVHHTYMCSSCHDVERRLVFAKQDEEAGVAEQASAVQAANAPEQASAVQAANAPEQTSAEPSPEHTAPPISPMTTLPSVVSEQIERAPATGVLRRVFARLRGG
jgi:hypothetical protein